MESPCLTQGKHQGFAEELLFVYNQSHLQNDMNNIFVSSAAKRA